MLETIQVMKRIQVEEGMNQRQKNNAVIADLKSQLDVVKEKLKARTEQEAQAADMVAEKTISKDLVLWRRKLDEMRNKT
jgi:hypothetical protein